LGAVSAVSQLRHVMVAYTVGDDLFQGNQKLTEPKMKLSALSETEKNNLKC
jgi:hypothetical protein